MHKSVGKIVSSRWLSLLLLLASAPLALAQKPAPQVAPEAPAPAARDVSARVTQTPVDASIKDDAAVDQMLAVYGPKVRALDVVIGKLKGELRKGGAGAGSLGNFVADGMRAEAGLKLGKHVALALMNGGGLRRQTIGEGDLRARDIFELLPFENALVTMDLTGEQVLKLLGTIVTYREAQSGARLTYVIKADKSFQLESAKLGDQAIDPSTMYTIVTIDYIISVAGEKYGVLREGKNTKALGITLRDAVMDYVKAETAAGRDIKPNLDGRFNLDKANSVLTGEAPPK
jgi:2',3'-cyclic-nucleotide 2'-phosphodiesterase (5'-nucleotidase family)